MTRPAVILVEWRDSTVAGRGWTHVDEVKRTAVEQLESLFTAGFLIADEATHLVVALSYNPSAEDVDGAIVIPREQVVRLTQLRKAAP